MTPKQKVEALLRKTVAAGCPVGEVIAANELAVRLAIQYRIPSNELTWPALPAGYRWEGQSIIPVVAAPKPFVTPKARVVHPQPTPAPKPATAPQRTPRGKAALVWQLIMSPQGATAIEIASAVGWQVHTVRGWVSLANSDRKSKGLPLIKTQRTPYGPRYYI